MTEAWPNTFKICQLNAENLFLFLDDPIERDWRKMTEKEWQKLTHASVPNKSLTKTLWLADTLLTIDADLVFISEVGGPESLTNFAHLFLKDRYKPQLLEGNSDRGIDVGFLVKSTFPLGTELRSHKNRPLKLTFAHENPPKTHYLSRDCAELRIVNPKTGQTTLICLSVHLKSKLDPEGIDPEGIDRRKAEMEAVCSIYQELRREFHPSIPTILAGDFNGCAKARNRAPEFQSINSTDLESISDILGRTDEQAATQLQFARHAAIQWLEIDYVFISPELKSHILPDKSEVFRYRSELGQPLPLPQTLDQRLQMPSDHYPVVVTFHNFLDLG